MNETSDDSQKKIVIKIKQRYYKLKLYLKNYYNDNTPYYNAINIQFIEDSKFTSYYEWVNSNISKYDDLTKTIEDKLVTYPNNTDLQKLKEDALISLANIKQAQILFSNEYERRLLEPPPIIIPPPTNGGKKNKSKKGKNKKYTFRKGITKLKSKKSKII